MKFVTKHFTTATIIRANNDKLDNLALRGEGRLVKIIIVDCLRTPHKHLSLLCSTQISSLNIHINLLTQFPLRHLDPASNSFVVIICAGASAKISNAEHLLQAYILRSRYRAAS